ncbi:hypothetical protein LTR91_013795 [Friedmanniomyces endolithicus]|uniref:Uncharacterized protein n=1 Tax=Friedmanniomyces endolithicus TaxID=329885 RepID=A0AAN6KCX4_9PEZI|nr:hypothetical protein LTR94_012168 [Friedmanniomyces endolithicus]KAK0789446.1 hypothetical protein LTR38_010928 [Friedmanniomyces endolithicus]KAK0796688.1 hypothetical protein LTR75_010128 [Friedmanniomyces endolithicus]KAK0804260.1 hypothetical protein LTR59_004389 [Friedmanniomyces endolithicus]KAK0840096.1 hypothetical protein LTR03_010780 [Friedmanniomyces endolithicus]
MSALRLAFTRRAAASFTARTTLPTRSFHSCRVLAVGKESELHNENRGEEAEAHKQDQLRKQKEGKGHWKDELASDSESIVGPPFHSRPLSGTPRYSWWGVKADRNEMGSAKENIEELQKETTRLANEEKKV